MNVDTLQQAQGIASSVLAGVKPDQLAAPTPCASWNVGELIDHLIGSQMWSTAAIEGRQPDETGEGSSAADYQAAFTAAAGTTLAAFSQDGALERTVNPGFGDMQGSAILGLTVTDTFTHAWDLATATGQDNDLDGGMAEELLAASRASIRDEYRGPEGAPFGPEQQAPDGANAAAQLAAFLGRSV